MRFWKWPRCFLVIVSMIGFAAKSIYAQSTSSEPTLAEGFNFRLGPYRDEAITRTIDALKRHDELQRANELENANKDIFSRTVDLFRFVPFKMADSSLKNDDFFTPNYLRPDYAPSRETQLFNVK